MRNKENPKEVLVNNIKQVLNKLGDSEMSVSAYDTAWVAKIPDAKDPSVPMFPQCLKWLQNNQNKDGSWGNRLNPEYYYDKIICTLAVVISLKIWQNNGMPLEKYIAKGVRYLNKSMSCLYKNKYRTVGFEILFPNLFREAVDLKLTLSADDVIDQIQAIAKKKFERLNFDVIFERHTALLHSLEGIPIEVIDWNKVIKLQDSNGSFLVSPSATAFVFLHTGNKKCLKYLQSIAANKLGIPTSYPIDIFETAWCLEIIAKLNLEAYFEKEYGKNINILSKHWCNERGISWSSFFDLPDLDTSSVVYYLLKKRNLQVAPEALEHFYKDDRLYCFPGELDSSPTQLLHFLQAYDGNNADLIEAAKQQVIPLLNDEWTDKWHLSAYYLTSVAIEPLRVTRCFEYTAIIDFILNNQHPDGGWGIHLSNLEETGWACMTLFIYLSDASAGQTLAVEQCLQKGIAFLMKRKATANEHDYIGLWIDKALYSPYNIINTLINAVILKYHVLK